MASAALQRSAAWAPPSPDQLASFYKLVDKSVVAGALCRHARNVELSSEASRTAEALFGDDSLVVADLRCCESVSVANLAMKASGAEKEALERRAWNVLISLINLLQRRLAANTLLPGTIREEELDYDVRVRAAAKRAQNAPVPPPAVLHIRASTMGYNTLLLAMFGSLNLLPLPSLPTVQTRMVQSFVLQGLDIIPRTAIGIPYKVVFEDDLVVIIEQMNPRNYDPIFYTAVLRKWRSHAVSSVLQARGVLQTGIAKYEQSAAEFQARQRADFAKHGLRDCALPSCAKTEKTVKEFAGCSGCRSVVYCCLEHQALNWRAHKKACREKKAARLAKEEAVDEGTGGGLS